MDLLKSIETAHIELISSDVLYELQIIQRYDLGVDKWSAAGDMHWTAVTATAAAAVTTVVKCVSQLFCHA